MFTHRWPKISSDFICRIGKNAGGRGSARTPQGELTTLAKTPKSDTQQLCWIRVPFGVMSGDCRGMGVLDAGGDRRRERDSCGGEIGASHCNQRGLCCVAVRGRRALPKLLWDDLFQFLLKNEKNGCICHFLFRLDKGTNGRYIDPVRTLSSPVQFSSVQLVRCDGSINLQNTSSQWCLRGGHWAMPPFYA